MERSNPRVGLASHSARGYNHVRRHLPCQDSSCVAAAPDGRWHVAVVSDGHGDPSCVRSDRGSRIATEVSRDCLREFAKAAYEERPWGGTAVQDLLTPSSCALAVRRLTDAIVSRWRDAVMRDIQDDPLTEEELAGVPSEMAENYRQGTRLAQTYGATLVCALWLPEALVLLQQGDGACLLVGADGELYEPVPDDPRCFANVTTSLCDADVADGIRHAVVSLEQTRVAACFLATDGVQNSVAADGGLQSFAKERLVELARSTDPVAMDESLGRTLGELSRKGNGDDASVALLCDLDAVSPLLGAFEQDVERWRTHMQVAVAQDRLASMERKHAYLQGRAAQLAHDKEDLAAGIAEAERQLLRLDEKTLALKSQLDALEAQRRQASARLRQAMESDDADEALCVRTIRAGAVEVTVPDVPAALVERRRRTLQEVANERTAARQELRSALKAKASLAEEILASRERLAAFDDSGIEEFERYDALRRELQAELDRLRLSNDASPDVE